MNTGEMNMKADDQMNMSYVYNVWSNTSRHWYIFITTLCQQCSPFRLMFQLKKNDRPNYWTLWVTPPPMDIVCHKTWIIKIVLH